MARAQFSDGAGKWSNIPVVDMRLIEPEKLAYEFCKQHGLLTRTVEGEGKSLKVLKEFKCQLRAHQK